MASSASPVPDPISASPNQSPSLSPLDVHLWHADLDDAIDPSAGAAVLSDDERERAARMAGSPRRRFIRSRCLLRTILGAYLNREPAALVFELTGEGKPVLAAARGASADGAAAGAVVSDGATAPDMAVNEPLHFNLSHASARWLLAVSRLQVGVDVERSDRRVDMESVARRIFRPEEVETILSLDGDSRRRAFFRAWTGREALVKAHGEGMFTLSLPAVIDVHPDRPLAVTGRGVGRWQLVEVPLLGEWCGALAVHGDFERVKAFVVSQEAS